MQGSRRTDEEAVSRFTAGHALIHGAVPHGLQISASPLARLPLNGTCRQLLLTGLGLVPTLN
jgi:hypothetical protein